MDHLFRENDLDHQLRERQKRIASKIAAIPEDQFLVSSDREIVEHLLPQLHVEPVMLQLDARTMNQAETQVDVSGDGMRFFGEPYRRGPFHIPGTRVDIDIPYTGEDWIFRYRTNPWGTVLPRGEARRGNLRISISLPHDTPQEKFKETYDREIRLIGGFVNNARKQVTAYNDSLESLVREAIAHRRSRLANHAGIADLLDIPLTAKDGAPPIKPVRIEIRRPPALPVPPKNGLRPEPGTPDETYERILHFIRHQGRTFETTPGTYALHDEEGLRDIMRGQLNGHFQGAATGEAFRGKGKTDICIEADNRAAFVGECKLWTGPASLTGALDQLLGYLTWRDSKASVIMFNRGSKNFSKIPPTIPDAIRGHKLFIRDLTCEEVAEWRVLVRNEEDEGRRVTVHVFLFNLYRGSSDRYAQGGSALNRVSPGQCPKSPRPAPPPCASRQPSNSCIPSPCRDRHRLAPPTPEFAHLEHC